MTDLLMCVRSYISSSRFDLTNQVSIHNCLWSVLFLVSIQVHSLTMRRLSAIVLLVLLTVYLININGVESAKCGQHGDDCNDDSQCCSGTRCHRFAKKCQFAITVDDLKNPQLKHNP